MGARRRQPGATFPRRDLLRPQTGRPRAFFVSSFVTRSSSNLHLDPCHDQHHFQREREREGG